VTYQLSAISTASRLKLYNLFLEFFRPRRHLEQTTWKRYDMDENEPRMETQINPSD